MKKGMLPVTKIIVFLIILFVLVILLTAVIPRIGSFKELFANLLESFK